MKQKFTLWIVLVILCITQILAQPIISNVSPLRAKIDSNVTITGSSFIAHIDSNIVYFGPVRATIVSATTTQIVAKVPTAASYQPISVTTARLTATANMPFNVRFEGQTTLSNSSFDAKIDSTSAPCYVTLSCDFDNDGKPDVASANLTANSITIYRNLTSSGNIAFASRQFVNTTDRVNNFRIVDIDGDGKKDIITANFSSSSFSVFRNTSLTGNISFAPRVTFSMPASTQPAYLASDDIDGDGKLDVLVTNYPLNGIAIFRNTSTVGNISFATRLDYTTQGTFPAGVEIADLNNDGKKDIIVSNSQQYSISVFQNLSTAGNILLASSVQYATTLGVHEVSVADLNNDGRLDIVAGDYASVGGATFATTITVLQNNSTIGSSFNASSFNTGVAFTAGLGAIGIRLGDMDGDGKTDVIVGNHQSNFISLFRNTSVNSGNISLAIKSDIVTGSQAFWVELADLNIDGKLDIIAANYGANTISFLKNNIDYLAPVINNVTPLRTKIDSLVTIVGENFSSGTENNIVYFGPVKAIVTSASPTELIVKTPLGAGYQPLSVTTAVNLTATAKFPSNIKFSGQAPLSNASFEPKIDSLASLGTYSVISCDFDNDGKPDVAVGNLTSNSVTIFRNITINNIIGFASRQLVATTFSVGDVRAADIDGDGKKDLLVTNSNGASFSVFRNISTHGNIAFSSRVTFNLPNFTQPTYLNADDLNGDGRLDIVVTNYPQNGFSVFRNTSSSGNISFASRVNYATEGTYPTAIEIADFNNDGKKDICVGNSQNYSISIFQNQSTISNISLASSVQFSVFAGVHELAVADLNNDGKLDLVTADYRQLAGGIFVNTISILQNKTINGANISSLSFLNSTSLTSGSGPRVVKLGDLDGDGKTDLVVGHANENFISLYKNISADNGTITFNLKSDISTGSEAIFVELADLTNDGKLDIMVGNYGSNTISFLKNNIAILPNASLLKFTAVAKSRKVELTWELEKVENISEVILEFSSNLQNWGILNKDYTPYNKNFFLHNSPVTGKNYYRLKQTNKDGKISYSEIRTVILDNSYNFVNIYPNPVVNHWFIINLGKEIAKKIKYIIFDSNGRIIKNGFLINTQTSINLPQTTKGTYYLKLETKEVFKIIVQ